MPSRSRALFSFSTTAVPGPFASSLGPADGNKNGQQGDDRERLAQKNDERKEKRDLLTFDMENGQMQYQQGPPQQVVVKEKKKNQGCLAVW